MFIAEIDKYVLNHKHLDPAFFADQITNFSNNQQLSEEKNLDNNKFSDISISITNVIFKMRDQNLFASIVKFIKQQIIFVEKMNCSIKIQSNNNIGYINVQNCYKKTFTFQEFCNQMKVFVKKRISMRVGMDYE